VSSKENLVVLAADRVWGELELPDPAEAGWRAAARTLVYDTLELTRRHPWLLSAVSTHLVYGPGMARFQDHTYAIYETAGFRGWELDWAANAVFTFATGTALVDAIDTAATTAQVPRGKGEIALTRPAPRGAPSGDARGTRAAGRGPRGGGFRRRVRRSRPGRQGAR
jgi:hypothetical protein